MPSRRSGAPPKFAVTQRLDEIVGLFLVAFGVFLALALWTYHPDDPSWSRKVSAGWAVRNYGGRVGAYLAGAFVQLAGSFSALLPLGFVAWGVTAFAGLRSWRPGWRELGGLVILLSAAGMLYKGFAGDPLFGPGALAGGVIGYGVGVLLQSYLGGAGSWVILLASFLASVVATTGISIGRLTALALRGSAWAAARLAWLAGFAAAAAAERGVPAVRRSAWAALSAAAAWPGRLGGRRSASGANGAGHEDAIGLLEAERSGPPLLPGPAENGGSGRRPKPLPAGPVLPMGAEEEETSGEGPSLFGGRKAPEAPFVLSGPAAEAEEPKGAAPGLPPRLNGRHGADENGGGGPGDGPVLFFQRESQRDGAPEGPAPRLLPSAPSGEKRPAGGLRIGRGRMIGSEPSVAPMPAASPANGKAGAPALSGTGDKGAGDKGKEAPAGPEVPAAAKETGTLEASGVVVRRAGVDGEPEIVRIEDDALVPEAIAAPVPGPERRRPRARAGYALPGLDMFADSPGGAIIVDEEAIRAKSRLLEQTLREFGVEGGITEVKTGPVITIYEFSPAAGVKVSKIAGLSDDLARALSALSVRIVAPIPGRSVVGIEVPNLRRNAVYAKEILASPEFQQAREKLTIGLGKDILGRTALTDLAKIPHLLIAGTTGSGKSVALNMMICSLLLRCHPREVRLLMIDPKMLELSIYEGVPHLLVPVVTDPKKAASALRGVLVEMERRYKMMSEAGVRNIEAYNQLVMEGLGAKEAERRLRRPLGGEEEFPGGGPDFMPYIVVVIDELADLMMVSSRDVEESMIRLAQMARAAGIHLLVATQRPSVDVLTGLIKANFPSRVALRVATRTDSRTILDANGAERLLGKGDMLFIPPGGGATVRIHGAYVSDKEIAYLVAHWKGQGPAAYQEEIFVEKEEPSGAFPGEEDEPDDRYDDAVALVVRTGEASISLIQRHLRIGYNRAARMIERMEQEGVIGPSDGIKRRQVLLRGIPGEE
ncbi:MAG: DNA translocase FtsK 4TM domain-containing protein [Candidatus Tectomicrobia bacterium]|uniref:DNA translocase FtsK 4TM domain-containing protein n=1 Tax=Tectimicrobiota bacterium TaxID=2528274 RepID=A0A932I1J4_UNCTE|nr:DNA translocase FtsK 4TM domain-containing protein [Candidatus Tectomicrobia bacterium]